MRQPRYLRRADVMERTLGPDVVLLLPSDEATVLEGGSAALWRALGTGPATAQEVSERLFSGREEGDEQVLVEAMLEELARLGAVEAR